MELYQYTPSECIKDESLGCKSLKAFARYMTRPANENENRQTFLTILFTCFIVTLVSFKFQDYITVGVEVPIKKIIDIIQKLADEPLKSPNLPDYDDELTSQLKTKILQ